MPIRHAWNTCGLSSIGGHTKTSKINFWKSNLEEKKKKKLILKEMEREEKRSVWDSYLTSASLCLWGCSWGHWAMLSPWWKVGGGRHKGQMLKQERFGQEKEKLFPQAGQVGNGPGCPERLCNLSPHRFKAQPENLLNNLVWPCTSLCFELEFGLKLSQGLFQPELFSDTTNIWQAT